MCPQHFERRRAIRASWALGFSNIFFFVAAEACSVPEALRASPGRCERSADTEATAEEGGMLLAHVRAVEVEDERLAREWSEHEDLVLVPGVEVSSCARRLAHALGALLQLFSYSSLLQVYSRLPHKLQAALASLVQLLS